MSALLEVCDLRVTFVGGGVMSRRRSRVHAVDGVSFDIGRGETFGLVGESGSGKTTTGRAILRLVEPTGGVVRFDGVDVTALGRRTPLSYRRDVQVIFQDPWSSLNPRRVIGETLADPLRRHRRVRDGTALRARIVELLDQVGLAANYAGRYPSELSGGQRQRVAIARAIAVEPRFIVCDEPVSALDVSTQSQVINLLQDLQERLELSYLFIAHDLSVVRHISRRVGIMRAGRLVECGDAERMYRDPQHPYTRALLDAVPTPDPARERARRRRRAVGDVPIPK